MQANFWHHAEIAIPDYFYRTRNTSTACLLYGNDVGAMDDGTRIANAIGSRSQTLGTSANSTNADPHSTELRPNWPRRDTATQALSSGNRTFTRTHCAKRCLQPIRPQDLIANRTQLGRSDWESEWGRFQRCCQHLFPRMRHEHAKVKRRHCASLPHPSAYAGGAVAGEWRL